MVLNFFELLDRGLVSLRLEVGGDVELMLAVGVVRGMGENIGVRLVLIVQFVETLEVESRATPEIL